MKPDDAKSWNDQGVALKNLGKYEEALAISDKAIKLKPEYAAAWHNRGIALEGLGRKIEAKESFQKTEELKNNE